MRTIQYAYSLLFPKNCNKTNKFGINNKSHFDFIFTNWRHHKSNSTLSTTTKNKVADQPTKNIIPEINITEQQEQQQQPKQNEQQKEEILEDGKRTESYEKRVAHPFEQRKKIKCHHLLLLQLLAPSKPKSFMPTAKSLMDARVAKKELKKKPGFKSN